MGKFGQAPGAGWRTPWLVFCWASLAACGRTSDDASGAGAGGPSEPGGTGAASSGGSGGAAGGAGGPTECETSPLPPRRVVRLDFGQIANSVEALLDADAASAIRAEFVVTGPESRSFPSLAAGSEGAVFSEGIWERADAIAQAVARRVFDDFEATTGCAAADDACGREFVEGFMQAAIRRPPAAAELDDVLRVYDEAKELGADVPEATQFGVYAVLDSPLFLYRSELGAPDATGAERALTPYETASALSFFLTDAPPDVELLAAAAGGELSTPEAFAVHVDRLLETPRARANLESVLMSYLTVRYLDFVVIDPMSFPEFGAELRGSMIEETRLFVRDNLWSRPISELLTSRRTRLNAPLAELYGVAFPPAGADPDANGFAPVELPPERAGLLTQASLLTARSRPDGASVVQRGLWVMQALACVDQPPSPEIEPVDPSAPGPMTRREQAEHRMATPPCAACHVEFDPYGLALDAFDGIGRFRTTDERGAPIDTGVELPAALDHAFVADARELATKLGASDRFTACLAKGFATFALAEGPVFGVESCEVQEILRRFEAGSDGAFSGLVREIALSRAFTVRSEGSPP